MCTILQTRSVQSGADVQDADLSQRETRILRHLAISIGNGRYPIVNSINNLSITDYWSFYGMLLFSISICFLVRHQRSLPLRLI